MKNKKPLEIVQVFVQTTTIGFKPAISLRRVFKDFNDIKMLVYAAMNDQPIIIMPRFRNKILSINSLVEKGIMYYNKETDSFLFNEIEEKK